MTPLPRAALAAFLCAAAGPALAHPHVMVTVRTEIVFDGSGKVAALRHAWTFDELYSAFQTQGLGKDGKPPTKEDLAPLAKLQAEQLADFDWFTVAKSAGRKAEFSPAVDYSLEEGADKLVTLRFTLPLKAPVSAGKAFSVQVYDPSYFVAFSLDEKDAATMAKAPAGCSLSVVQPPPLVASEAQKLNESYFSGLSPGADFGIKLAPRMIVACP